MDFNTYPQIRRARDRCLAVVAAAWLKRRLEPLMATFDQLRPDWLTEPGSDRFNARSSGYTAAMAAHQDAVEAGEPGYLDPESGLFVMTAVFLRDRGWCCDCGCRHCPYLR